MGIARDTMTRVRGTKLTAALRKSPTAFYIAQQFWNRTQSRYFKNACRTISHPAVTATTNTEPLAVEVPTLESVVAKLPDFVLAGEEFSREMGQWCSTSKFLSYTARPDSCGYQDIYAQIFKNLRGHDVRILEIGMGINDPTVKSGMPVDHRPGASLAGWCGYFPGAEVHGADVDRRCLIDTDQYKTHFADQLDPESLYDLASKLSGGFDIVVDDGLHTPEANVNVMAAFLPLLKPHGVMVIEDIVQDFDLLWSSTPDYLPKGYRLDYFPSSVLRQFRARSAQGCLAVITRR